MSLILHGAPLSPYVTAIRAALAEKSVPYRFAPIGPEDLKTPEYGKMHPFRKLPVLDADGRMIYETAAILRYVDEGFDGPSLQPQAAVARALSEQWMSVANSYLYGIIFTGLVFPRLFAPKLGLPTDETAINRSAEIADDYVGILAAALSAGTLGVSQHPTIGDLLVAAVMLPLSGIAEGQRILAEYPEFGAWLLKMSSRPSFAQQEVTDV